MKLTYTGEGDSGAVVLETTLAGKRTPLCTDIFLVANEDTHHLEAYFFAGTHRSTLQIPGKNAVANMQRQGLYTYLFCEGVVDELLSVFTSLKAFVGGFALHGKLPLWSPRVPKYMEDANVEFLKWAVNYTLEERKTQTIEIDEDSIASGDYLAIMRLDGLDPMIMYGTGSHSGHTTTALRFDGELYIVES